MAFIIENGTGVLGANSYGSFTGYVAYFADRGVTITDTQAVVQGLLVKATDYIDTRWGLRFLGRREWLSMTARSVLTLTGQPTDGEAVTVGSITYIFRTTPTLDLEVEIGSSELVSLANLATVMNSNTNDDLSGTTFADCDIAALTVYTAANGVATTETITLGAFDLATSAGASSRQQPLEFPRVDLRDRTGQLVLGVPDRAVEATYEYANRASSAALAPDPVIHSSGLRRTKDRSKVGPLETDIEFADDTGVQITKPYPAADRLLQEYVRTGGVIRA